MRRLVTRTALAVLALAAAWSLILGGTLSAYTASTATPSGPFVAALDWVAPTVSTAVIGRTTAYDTGTIKQGATYYAYANASDTGNPASGVASVSANLSSLTTGKTAVAMTAGTYSAGGVSYGWRSPSEVAANPLAAGTSAFGVTSTDAAANSGTQSFNTTVDNTGPFASDVQSTNHTGGTVGHMDQGDTITLTYNQPVDPYSVVAGWNGSSYSDVQVALLDGGGSAGDSLYFYTADSSPVPLPLGTVDLSSSGYLNTGSGTYIEYGTYGAVTPTTMIRNGASITFTLGTPSASSSTSTTSAAMVWSPSATATDIAGNAASTATATQSGAPHKNF
jgi:hypothetical protein